MADIAPLISDLAVILVIAGIVILLFKWLKQPVVLGYIVAGVLAGPYFPFMPTVSDPVNIRIWADIGVIFLLFAMGLEFSFKKLMNVGGTAVIAAITIVSGMMSLGYVAGHAMGFSHISSLFLGGMLSMSSTAIVFKAFDDMGLRQQKFTGVVLGILVVEDLVAVVLMVLLSTLAVSQEVEGKEMIGSILKLLAFLVFWSLLGIYLIPTFLKRVRKLLNDETLLILALGLCLGMVMIATHSGFSAALGAFVMGSLLAETFEAEKIEKLVRPVKDLFGAIFFVSVGMMVQPETLLEYGVPILVLTGVVLIGQVFFASAGILLSGQPLKIALQSGFSLTQVGEFAFIIASLGVSLKVTDDFLYPVIVAVSVITTFLTPYMIRLSEPAYRWVERILPASWQLFLSRYASGSNTVKHKSTWHKLLKSMLFSVAIYAVLVLFSTVLFFTYVEPPIRENLPGLQGALLSLLIILSVISPFLWAIMMSKNRSSEFRKLWNDNKYNRGPLVSLLLIRAGFCAAVLTFVMIRLFNVAAGVGAMLSLSILALVVFSKRLKQRMLSIEQHFMENFNGSEKKTTENGHPVPVAIGPLPFQEMHLAGFTVSQHSPFVGKSLKEIGFYQHYGINIVSIVRGEQQIGIPDGKTRLYPFDEIVAVGTDTELERLRNRIAEEDRKNADELAKQPKETIRIEQFEIGSGSALIGKTIAQSAIRERAACMILGIERIGVPVTTPTAETVFREGDIVWVAGESEKIRRFSEKQEE